VDVVDHNLLVPQCRTDQECMVHRQSCEGEGVSALSNCEMRIGRKAERDEEKEVKSAPQRVG
jgi:hypothetical protein